MLHADGQLPLIEASVEDRQGRRRPIQVAAVQKTVDREEIPIRAPRRHDSPDLKAEANVGVQESCVRSATDRRSARHRKRVVDAEPSRTFVATELSLGMQVDLFDPEGARVPIDIQRGDGMTEGELEANRAADRRFGEQARFRLPPGAVFSEQHATSALQRRREPMAERQQQTSERRLPDRLVPGFGFFYQELRPDEQLGPLAECTSRSQPEQADIGELELTPALRSVAGQKHGLAADFELLARQQEVVR